jgi:hypothetical protein
MKNVPPTTTLVDAGRLRLLFLLQSRAERLAKDGVPGVKYYPSKGIWYAYHRPTHIRIHAKFASPAFFSEYLGLARIYESRCKREGLGSPSSLGSSYERLQQHRDFLNLPIRTRNRFNQAASWLLKSSGTTPTRDITEPLVLQLRDRARRAGGIEFSNVVLALMKTLMAAEMELKLIERNPIENIRRLSDTHDPGLRARRRIKQIRVTIEPIPDPPRKRDLSE